MKRKKKIICLLIATIISMGGQLDSKNVLANEQYPVSDAVTDANGITMTNSASWVDEIHMGGNYNANLEISINGLKDTKSFNEPIDVQIVQDISTSMDEVCYNPSHVNFQYYKKITDAFTAEQINTEYKPLIENS